MRWGDGAPECRMYYRSREQQQAQFKAVRNHLPPGPKHLLDVGSGYGDFTYWLPPEYTYKGIEARKELVEAARELYPDYDFEHTTRLEPADVIVALASVQSEFVPANVLVAQMCELAPLVIVVTTTNSYPGETAADLFPSPPDLIETPEPSDDPSLDDDWILLAKGTV